MYICTDVLPSTAEVAVCYDRLTHLITLSPLEHIIVSKGQQNLTAQPSENALAALFTDINMCTHA